MIDLAYICSWRTEIAMLAATIVLGVVHLSWAAVASRKQQGLRWARGARDEAVPVSGVAARLNRAYANFMETYVFFAAAILGVVATEAYSAWSQWGALLYLAARTLYVPAYASGTASGLRTLIWFAGLIGLLMVLAALILGGGASLPTVLSA